MPALLVFSKLTAQVIYRISEWTAFSEMTCKKAGKTCNAFLTNILKILCIFQPIVSPSSIPWFHKTPRNPYLILRWAGWKQHFLSIKELWDGFWHGESALIGGLLGERYPNMDLLTCLSDTNSHDIPTWTKKVPRFVEVVYYLKLLPAKPEGKYTNHKKWTLR